VSVTVVVDDAAIEALFGPAGPVAEFFVSRVVVPVFDRAQLRAPVGQPSKTPEGHPAGWLKSQITWEFVGPLEARVSTSAVLSKASGRPGDPYGRWIERPQERPWKPPPFARADRPYLVPALDEIFGELNG
jgi:hypothetical protein